MRIITEDDLAVMKLLQMSITITELVMVNSVCNS